MKSRRTPEGLAEEEIEIQLLCANPDGINNRSYNIWSFFRD